MYIQRYMEMKQELGKKVRVWLQRLADLKYRIDNNSASGHEDYYCFVEI